MLFPVAWHQEYVLSPAVRVAGLLLSVPSSGSRHDSRAGHPALRYSSLTYGLYARSSRLAIRAPRAYAAIHWDGN